MTTATNFDTGLAALDATVARWRSSLVVVSQALSRAPLVLTVGAAQITAPLPAAPAGSQPAAPGPVAAPTASASTSDTNWVALVIGLVLLALARVAAGHPRAPAPGLRAGRAGAAGRHHG